MKLPEGVGAHLFFAAELAGLMGVIVEKLSGDGDADWVLHDGGAAGGLFAGKDFCLDEIAFCGDVGSESVA